MKLNVRYTGTVSSIEKSGRGFTSSSGTKYINYTVRFEEYPMSYQMALRKDLSVNAGDTIKFTLKLDKKKKIRAYDIDIIKYEINFPLRKQPTYFDY